MIKYQTKHKGVTLVELLAVIVILGILAAVGFVTIGNLISRTSIKAYEETVNSLNQATMNYVLWDGITTEDAFEGLEANSSRISILLTQGYISKVTQPNFPYSYDWNISTQLWLLSSEEIEITVPEQINYNFEEDRLAAVIEQGGVIALGNFTDSGSNVNTSYGILFIDNKKSDYTILVKGQLTNGDDGGYGIFFETIIDEELKDTGFVLQLDRGFANGEIIIRTRVNGVEKNLLNRYEVRFDDSGNGEFVLSGGQKNKSNPWWTKIHDIKMIIKDINDSVNNKQVSLYIDNVFIFTFKFTSSITPSTRSENQTGLRVWRKNTIFYSFEVR